VSVRNPDQRSWEATVGSDRENGGYGAEGRLLGDLITGTLSSGAYIMTICYDGSIQRVNTLDIQLRGR
jgi:hypothetical protein